MSVTDVIGAAASILVVCSFYAREERTIRTVNIVGAFLFVVYGGLVDAPFTALCNGALVLLHLVRLRERR